MVATAFSAHCKGEYTMTPQELAVVAAGLSFLAAAASATAAWRVPYAVARFAEERRKESDARSRKMAVLETLIQYRATIAYAQSVAALNSIPTVFSASPKVHEAFTRFMAAANAKPFNQGTLVERHLLIISAMIQDLGLDAQISATDVDSFYYPELLGRAHEVEQMDVIVRSRSYEPSANNDPRSIG